MKLLYKEVEFFARCSLLFAGCSLLVARCSLLFARCSLAFMGNGPAISHTCYPYLPSRLSLFLSLVLLKEMRKRGESKISSCWFCVLCKSKELGGRGKPRFPCITPVMEGSSDLLRAIIR